MVILFDFAILCFFGEQTTPDGTRCFKVRGAAAPTTGQGRPESPLQQRMQGLVVEIAFSGGPIYNNPYNVTAVSIINRFKNWALWHENIAEDSRLAAAGMVHCIILLSHSKRAP